MFWVILGIALMYVGCGIAGAATLFSPIYGIYSVITKQMPLPFPIIYESLFIWCINHWLVTVSTNFKIFSTCL